MEQAQEGLNSLLPKSCFKQLIYFSIQSNHTRCLLKTPVLKIKGIIYPSEISGCRTQGLNLPKLYFMTNTIEPQNGLVWKGPERSSIPNPSEVGWDITSGSLVPLRWNSPGQGSLLRADTCAKHPRLSQQQSLWNNSSNNHVNEVRCSSMIMPEHIQKRGILLLSTMNYSVTLQRAIYRPTF